MAAGSWWTDSPNLRQLFPAVLSAASEGATTAGIWQSIRDAAQATAEGVLNVTLGRAPTDEEVASYSQNLLAGISATDVSQARGAAGEMLTAHRNLQNTGPTDQINANAIARPPWATTVNNPAVQEQYRIRIQREIEVRGFTRITRQEWATYDLSGPLTSVADAVNQANTLFEGADYNRRASITQILDYTIEAV